MTNVEQYTYRVAWSPADGEFVGVVAEFPSLSLLAMEQVDALVGIRSVVADVVADLESNGEAPPVPLAD